MKLLAFVLVFVVALSASSFAQGLARVGPTDKSNGFPLWYQDKDGVALDLCLPNQAELANGACVLLAADIPNPDAPIVFPNNFPEEAFWFLGNATMNVPGGRATLVMATEAAFANAGVVAGDQITFARLRILFDAAEAGHYKVTTPYGVREFDVAAPGKRAVFSTEDVGIGAPGDFSGALNGSIGPFLHASATVGGDPSPLFSFGGNQYLADPGTTTRVTGSPLGAAFNVFRIEGPIDPNASTPAPVFETDQFTLNGKVHTAAIPSPMQVERATYGRDSNGLGHVDVFASAKAGIGNAAPKLTMSGPGLATTTMTEKNGKFFAQAVFNSGRPNVVTVTNTADNPPTTINFPIVDEIEVKQADYDPVGQTLKISAQSSDALHPPALVYDEKMLNSGSLTITGVVVPPASVTVQSTYTGRTTVPVSVAQGDGQPPAPGATPTANNDSAAATGATPVIIAILANDDPQTVDSVRVITNPSNGTAELLSDNTVRYTANVGFSGDDSFQYVTSVGGVDSHAATVTVSVTAANAAPVARDDSATAVAGGAARQIRINVLVNDSDPDGDALNPASLAIAMAPSFGSAVVDNGTVLYTPPLSGAATDVFKYTVADSKGSTSAPATVTVNVTAGEAITVTKANYKVSGSEWDIVGTSTLFGPGNRMTIDLMRSGVKIATVGTADVDNLGAWRLRSKGSPAIARAGDTLQVTSTQKTVVNNVAIRLN